MIYENIGMRSVIYIFNIMYNDYTMVIFYKNIFDVITVIIYTSSKDAIVILLL